MSLGVLGPAQAAINGKHEDVGGVLCVRFLNDNSSLREGMMWVAGYLSAVNAVSPLSDGVADITQDTPWSQRVLFLENWCRAHGGASVAEGMPDLLTMMQARTKAKSSPLGKLLLEQAQ